MIAAWFTRLARVVVLSEGWRRRLVALVCGAVGGLALPPFGLVPAIAVPMIAAVWLLDSTPAPGRGARSRVVVQAAHDGWWLGFGYFGAGLWWLGSAFLVEADQFLWALPFGVLGLPAMLAAFMALGFAAAKCLWSPAPSRVFALAAALGASEWLRSVLFTGFPWNNFGMALGGNLILAQSAALVGLTGLTFIAIAIAAAPAVLADKRDRSTALPVSAFAALALLITYGAARLHFGAAPAATGAVIRIMQPNVPQAERFGPDAMRSILDGYMELSTVKTSNQPEGLAGVTHLVWPDSAFPGVISRDPEALRLLGQFLPVTTTLITGAARSEPAGRGWSYFNSIHVIQSGGLILDTYDKTHLVPFGEYLPFRKRLESLGLRQFIAVPGGFEPGVRNEPLRTPGLGLILPLICYEAIFPGASSRLAGPERPVALVNLTNDGWFGRTPGPYQHFAQARLRAIEEGLPMVRAANSGVSAIIDPYGRVVSSLGLDLAGVVDGRLPGSIAPPPFSRAPAWPPMVLLAIFLLSALVGRRGRA